MDDAREARECRFGDVDVEIPERDVSEIEEMLREIAGESPRAHPADEPTDKWSAIPEDLPVATIEEQPERKAPEGRDVAVAEPMTVQDAAIVALGDNVRQVNHLIESIGRTLEAQNQRSLNLMDRLERVARALENMPEEADRQLEGLDAVEEAIKAQQKPIEALGDRLEARLEALPGAVEALNRTNESTRELWTVATRALAGRMAFAAHEERLRDNRERTQRRWRLVGGAALAMAAFVSGAFLSDSNVGGELRGAIARAITAGEAASADQGERTWRVTDVKRLNLPTAEGEMRSPLDLHYVPLPRRPEEPMRAMVPPAPTKEEEPLGTDEEQP